jgi:hypothetical protein
MCDRIRVDDERNVQLKLMNDNCLNENEKLENCLTINFRDFRKCKTELSSLKLCMDQKFKNKDADNEQIKF